ncbi:RiPP maturation radical SAM protein 1 (plasmid) [Streptomyces globosus]|uniref:RiPP maturation radical SAM protein 1 n=1 Tax=Streptomyces globosus TaxID=68209 RepID=A0A344UBE1_9ACTN|nr:RiPP maturation radical SAM C-methyltransferase [Streptomyces globosus]AXE28212.1 RiPP maturation radical SAM protein 1 [Streptomyces globosus]
MSGGGELKLIDQPLFPPDCVPARPLRIGLVNMPWARTDTPSIQCGLLQAALRSFGHDARSVYPNLELAAELGTGLYEVITEAPSERVHLFGEWLFGTAAFGVTEDVEDYRLRFPEVAEMCAEAGADWDSVADLRGRRLPAWIDELAARGMWSEFDIVGFTSTFIQNVAALALARRLKEARPELITVFGGANYDGDMGPEYLRNFDFIDYVVVGEGDVTLPRLAAAVARGADPAALPGVCGRTPDGRVTTPSPGARTREMDQLPIPDYDDYFTALDALGRDRVIGRNTQRLLVEFSRGCWWGAKHHCTFCGLNALGMQYRAKSPERALAELEELMRRHRVLAVDAVDNILDMAYLDTFCSGLRGAPWDTALFFEVKANLTRDQVRLLSEAGVWKIQPGLESLSTHVLGLMRKGSSRLLNVRLLKWAHYYGVRVDWNVLAGFPGETDEDYTGQASLVPLLTHLEPPAGVGRIWLERFSPYFTDPSFGMGEIRPKSAYRLAFPVPGLDHGRIAYFFDYRAPEVASPDAVAELAKAVEAWGREWASADRPTLTYRRGPDWLTLFDTRGGRRRKTTLAGWRARAYELCGDAPRSAARIHRELGGETGADGGAVGRAEVEEFLGSCVAHGICLEEDGKYLSLALPLRSGLPALPGRTAAGTGTSSERGSSR